VIKIRNKAFVFTVLLLLVVNGFVSAEDTYLESLQKMRDQVAQSEKNIREDISSFNEAFKDTFRLLDQEVSRLIYANAAMAGVVFAIMFLVYAKTTSRYKRDIQVLLAAHGKHIDNIISTRLEEFEARMVGRERSKDVGRLSKLGGEFDMVISSIADEEGFARKVKSLPETSLGDPLRERGIEQRPAAVESKSVVQETVKKPEKKGLFAKLRFKETKHTVPIITEARIDESDGKVRILDGPSTSGNKFLKRLKRGLMRLVGKKPQTQKVIEFKK